MTITFEVEAPGALPLLDEAGRALLFSDARTANSFAPTPVTDAELDGNKAKTASAPAVAVLAVDTRYHEHIPQLLPFRPELKDVLADNHAFRTETMRFSGALQAGYFLLAVRAHGLTAGPMGGFDAVGLDADFFPDSRWKSILVVNIGHPGRDPWYGRLPRLDHSDVIKWA